MSVEVNVAATFNAIRTRVTGAIQGAASATGASFQYLLAAAKIESNLNPTAAASASSARGLYQFIEQTWLGTVKEAGGHFGYGQYADAITRLPSGRYAVSDPAMRETILKLRDDPVMNAAMAGVLSRSNSAKLTGLLGRRPSDGELYIAHFLGVGGAAKLISAAENTPGADAARLFPEAAASNQSIFYDRSGRARSVDEVYANLNRVYAHAADAPVVRTAMASAGVSATQRAMAFVQGVGPQTVGEPLQLRPARSASAQNEPVFRTLFHVGDRQEPVSPAVQSLWTTTRTAEAAPASPFDLFSDRGGRFAG